MNGPDYLAAAAALFNVFTFDKLVPVASLSFFAFMFVLVLFRAQRSSDFDTSQFLRDDKAKLSSGRLFAFICCMTHTWLIFTRTINDKIQFDEQVLYAVTWSGSLVLLEALNVWRGGARIGPPPAPAPTDVSVGVSVNTQERQQ